MPSARELIHVNPAVLKWARERANIHPEDVADKLNKSLADIVAWEEGSDWPTYPQLENMAYKLYKCPIAIFFFPSPPQEIEPKTSFRTLPQSEIEDLSPRMLYLFRQAQVMQINLSDLAGKINPSPRKIIKDLSFTPQTSAQVMSARIREYLGVDVDTQRGWKGTRDAFRHWREIIERNGVSIFKEAFDNSKISGFCIYDTEFPIIYVNNSMPFTRQIFTLFHELAHLFLRTGGVAKTHDDFIPKLRGDAKDSEILCNRFAGEFLVPESDFSRHLPSLPIEEENIRRVADRYWVSREVILRKCFDRKMIGTKEYEEKAKMWIDEAERRPKGDGGNYYLTQVAYLGDNYLRLAFKKYYERAISIHQLAEYLRVKIASIQGMETVLMGRN
jgi:Zn-dependent peptidase ImmA (M78 family)